MRVCITCGLDVILYYSCYCIVKEEQEENGTVFGGDDDECDGSGRSE